MSNNVSSTTTTTTTMLAPSSPPPPGVPFSQTSLESARFFFPSDFNYLFSNRTNSYFGFDLSLLNFTQIITQSIGVSASFTISPAAGFDVSRGFVLSRIASCPERDPLYYNDQQQGSVRWMQREELDFPETLLPISFFGFGPKERGFPLRVAVLSWLILILVPIILGWLFVKPVAPTGKIVGMFFAATLCLGWGFSSGLLLGSVAFLNSPEKKFHFFMKPSAIGQNETAGGGDLSREDVVIIDWVISIVPILIPLFMMLYYSRILHSQITAPVKDDATLEELEQELLKERHQQQNDKKQKNKNQRKKNNDDDDDDDEQEDHDEFTQSKKSATKLDKDEEKARKRAEEDLKKRKHKKTPLHVVISKAQFNTPGVAKKSPWKIKLRDWLNTSKIAKFLFVGTYCWKGGELPVIEELMSFDELKKLRQERIDVKKKKEEQDRKLGIKKKKGLFDQLSESDDDENEGRGGGGGFTGMISRYGVSKRNFFDDDDEDDGGGGGGGFFDDPEIPVVTEEETPSEAKNEDDDNNNGNDDNNQQQEEANAVVNEDDIEVKEETEEEKKKRELLENPKLDIVLPERPKLNSAQITFNRMGFLMDTYYGPPEPLSIEEANRRNIRLPWKEYFVSIVPHYTTFNAVLSVVFSLLCGMSAACPECMCETTYVFYALTVLLGIDVAFVAVTRPFLVPVQNILSVASNGVLIAACILSFLKLPPDLNARTFTVQLLCLIVIPAIALAKIVFAFVQFALLYLGNLDMVSIYHDKTNREIKMIQKKLKKTESNVSEKRQREYEEKATTVRTSKKGGIYHRQASSQNNNNDDDEELLMLPRKSSSKFRRRAKTRQSIDEENEDESQHQQQNYEDYNHDEDGNTTSPSAAAAASSDSYYSPRSSPRSARKRDKNTRVGELASSKNKDFLDRVDI